MTTSARLAQIEAMLADEPNDPELHYMLAMEHVSAGDDAGAVPRFEKLVVLAPSHTAAYHQGGRALHRLDRLAEARDWLTRGVAVALKQGDDHAAGEMRQLLEYLDQAK